MVLPSSPTAMCACSLGDSVQAVSSSRAMTCSAWICFILFNFNQFINTSICGKINGIGGFSHLCNRIKKYSLSPSTFYHLGRMIANNPQQESCRMGSLLPIGATSVVSSHSLLSPEALNIEKIRIWQVFWLTHYTLSG